MTGAGGVHGKAAFNLLGGSIEWDMDTSKAHGGINNNFYTVSPDKSYFPKYCDIQKNDSPQCMEMDLIENNGACFGQTTWHTWPNKNGGCDEDGCYGQFSHGGTFHMKAEFSQDGWMTVSIDGNKIDVSHPVPSKNAQAFVAETMKSKGAQIQSTQWQGWVPKAGACGSGDLGSSVFSVSNVRVVGTVVQGPEPTKCAGSSYTMSSNTTVAFHV